MLIFLSVCLQRIKSLALQNDAFFHAGTIFHFTGQLAAGGVNVIAPCFAHGRHDACIIQDFAECLHCGLG